MVKSKDINILNGLIQQLIEDYIEKGIYEIAEFKKKLRELILNPLSFDERIQKIINLVENEEEYQDNFEFLWRQVEDVLNRQSSEKIKKKELQKEKIRTYEKKLVKFLVDIGKRKGTNETLSAIIAYLLIYKHLTQLELKKLSGYSRGAISENLKILVNYGFVHKKLIEGTRKYEYTIGESMAYVAKNVSIIKSLKAEELLKFVDKKISQLKKMDNQSRNGLDLLSKRLEEMKEFCILLENILFKVISSNQIQSIMGDKFESN
ncbi:MAG: hypothetical protein BAJALOKI3v1_790008 [Promethearchaeota archaeon]|nr:MAG: hypothetical protein BAJALOKI3v1_790008 [Candidatus Lokiarchaeota archaeon]